jgi:hypothetical protein
MTLTGPVPTALCGRFPWDSHPSAQVCDCMVRRLGAAPVSDTESIA